MHRTAPPGPALRQRTIWPEMSVSPKLRNSDLVLMISQVHLATLPLLLCHVEREVDSWWLHMWEIFTSYSLILGWNVNDWSFVQVVPYIPPGGTTRILFMKTTPPNCAVHNLYKWLLWSWGCLGVGVSGTERDNFWSAGASRLSSSVLLRKDKCWTERTSFLLFLTVV